jgi:hypothetical protein
LRNTIFIENFTHRSGSPLFLTPARPAGGGGTDLWGRLSWRRRLEEKKKRKKYSNDK